MSDLSNDNYSERVIVEDMSNALYRKAFLDGYVYGLKSIETFIDFALDKQEIKERINSLTSDDCLERIEAFWREYRYNGTSI